MGHKVHPYAFRLGKIFNWHSRWLGKKNVSELLKGDAMIRRTIKKELSNAAIEKVIIERLAGAINIIIYSARPGVIIGRGGVGIDELKKKLAKIITDKKAEIKIDIQEVKNPLTSAPIIAQGVAEQLEKRVPFRRVLKQTLERVMTNKEIEGTKIAVSGRLGGTEMARREWLARGKIPLHTLRANIDFARANAYTTYGVIGVKVWIYKGEVFDDKSPQERQ